MALKAAIPLLVTMMLITGVCNTLLTKLQDMQCIANCDDPDKTKHKNFEQPVIQTVQMFIGEMGCWLVVFGFWLKQRYVPSSDSAPLLYQPIPTDAASESLEDVDDTTEGHGGLLSPRNSFPDVPPALKPLVSNTTEDRLPLTGWKTTLLALPACCDITGTTLMNVGLLLVAASIYQMTRGALVLFVGLFSVLFLKRKLYLYHWFSLFVVVLGVAIVGLAGALFGDKHVDRHDSATTTFLPATKLTHRLSATAADLVASATQPTVIQTVTGIFLIAFAQIFTATQFCLEEWILENYALEPIRVVGWEGVFGFVVTTFLQIILHYSVGNTAKGHGGFFDAATGYDQMLNDRLVAVTSVLIMISIGGFNFFGLSVTRSISATSRSIIDTCRTLFIWIVSLGLGWESFKWLQVLGFALLVYGTFLFNDLVRPPLRSLMPRSRREMGAAGRLLPEEPIEHL